MASDTVMKSMIESLHIYREAHDRKFDQLGNKIEDLAVQISHLTTTVDRMAQSIDRMSGSVDRSSGSIDRMAQAVERLSESVDGHLQIARQQSMNIAELTKLVANQSNTVNRLIDRVTA
jgi:methyl-accepting chemotaxis protein